MAEDSLKYCDRHSNILTEILSEILTEILRERFSSSRWFLAHSCQHSRRILRDSGRDGWMDRSFLPGFFQDQLQIETAGNADPSARHPDENPLNGTLGISRKRPGRSRSIISGAIKSSVALTRHAPLYFRSTSALLPLCFSSASSSPHPHSWIP